MKLIYYIPILTCSISIAFAVQLFRNWISKNDNAYMLWWFIGVVNFGVGTFTESFNSINGWTDFNFRLWYISGALIGGTPLAQGTVYLILPKRIADILAYIFFGVAVFAATAVLNSPIDYDQVDPIRMSGKVFEWQWIRGFTPFINIYALLFLAGGAIYSAVQYFRVKSPAEKVWGNILIAVGAILPGIGGTATRYGHIEWLYVTELAGLLMIFAGYLMMKKVPGPSIHENQR